MIRRVFRIGVIELRRATPSMKATVRLFNRTTDRTVELSTEEETRWRAWLVSQS